MDINASAAYMRGEKCEVHFVFDHKNTIMTLNLAMGSLSLPKIGCERPILADDAFGNTFEHRAQTCTSSLLCFGHEEFKKNFLTP